MARLERLACDRSLSQTRATLGAQVTWNRINYEHRDGTRLKLNVREVTSDTLIASVTQSELEPGRAKG